MAFWDIGFLGYWRFSVLAFWEKYGRSPDPLTFNL